MIKEQIYKLIVACCYRNFLNSSVAILTDVVVIDFFLIRYLNSKWKILPKVKQLLNPTFERMWIENTV